jgi:hypothetical protein
MGCRRIRVGDGLPPCRREKAQCSSRHTPYLSRLLVIGQKHPRIVFPWRLCICVRRVAGVGLQVLLPRGAPAIWETICIRIYCCVARCIARSTEKEILLGQRVRSLRRAAFDPTGIYRQNNHLLRLHAVVRPHAIGLPQHRLIAVVLDTEPSKRVLWAHLVYIDQGVAIFILSRRRGGAHALV